MDLDRLSIALEHAAPSLGDLAAQGCTQAEATVIVATYRLPRRTKELQIPGPPGVLGELFRKFDPSNLVIGMVRFSDIPRRINSGWVIGKVEADPLLCDHKSGRILVEDANAVGWVLWECAESGEQFLASLLSAAQYLSRCIDDTFRANKLLSLETLAKCVEQAGGIEYRDFFLMLLGIE